MKDRVITNWKTSLIGLVIILVGIIALFTKVIDGTGFIGFTTTAIPLIVAKDTLIEGLTGGIVKKETNE
jgi:hypothetical protein